MPSHGRGGRWRLVIFGVVVLGLFTASFFVPAGRWLGEFRDWVARQGAGGAAAYAGVYVACTVLLVPGSILTLAAGWIYGPVWGTVIVSVASTIGAALAFLAGRYLARDRVRAWIQGNPTFAAVDSAIARRGGWIVLLLRLSPIFPFNFVNYALGLTGVRFPTYLLASWAGMLPGTVAYVLIGHAGQETLTGGPKVVFWVIAAVATLAVTFLITWAATRAIRDATAPAGSPEPASVTQSPGGAIPGPRR